MILIQITFYFYTAASLGSSLKIQYTLGRYRCEKIYLISFARG